jgi:putative ABC transport system ATP-binding protein
MHLIEINNIGKDYASGGQLVAAVNDVNFFIDDGEFVSVIGQSGAGKSTLLSILGGLNHPTRGKLLIDTLDIYSLSSEQRADFRSEYIGFIFQSFQLIPYLTVKENVKLPMAITGTKGEIQEKMAVSVLDRVGLAGKVNRLPDQLSGGEQERVAIARAVVNKPPILLADEPTGNLDTKTAEEVITLLKELNGDGQTVIVVSHNPDICRHTHKTLMVKDGTCMLN